MTTLQPRKKLIEVALPLEEINIACKADKDRKTGTLRNIHKWFAPMPLPAWRALLFAALIDDPEDDEARAALLDVMKRLVANGADLPAQVDVDAAAALIGKQFPDGVPTVFDPFCGGGSTLVEAQRLQLPTYGSDLNPVPALISRTLSETLPRVAGGTALHAPSAHGRASRSGGLADGLLLPLTEDLSQHPDRPYEGLVRDVTYYGDLIREEAWASLSHLYQGPRSETPVAWLWATTATCPNPACRIDTILSTSWWLSKKKGDLAWLQPTVEQGGSISLAVVRAATGEAPSPPKTGRGVFECVRCRAALDERYLRAEGQAGRLGTRMTAVVAERGGQRIYRAVEDADLAGPAAATSMASGEPLAVPMTGRAITNLALYGIDTWDKVFTPRQLITLTTFADLVASTHARVIADGGSEEWATAVTTLLGLAVGQLARSGSTQCLWRPRPTAHGKAESAFGRNDMPMMWDFAETFFLGGSVGDWSAMLNSTCRALSFAPAGGPGRVVRRDARAGALEAQCLVATDPPYFDAVGYADLSDYFYLWHRRALRDVHPDLYATVAAPKVGELTAIPAHHGGDREVARAYFVDGFTETFANLKRSMAPDLPMLIVYASKEQKGGREEETRWSSILTAMVRADLEITGTWPIHGTSVARMISASANTVASYVVMVCRPRQKDAATCSLADFNRALRRELRPAIHDLQAAGILPVDLAQAAMGPGMQVYSRFRAVSDQDGRAVPVEQALRLINAALSEVLDEQEGELDPDSRFAIAWWERHGWNAGAFGEADQLARPQGISVDDVVRAGVVHYPRPGFVAALGAGELDRSWTPSSDRRPTAWEAVHHLADRLINGGGTSEAARLMGHLQGLRDPAQALVYRLHAIAARKGWTSDQERYNALIGSWSDLLAVSASEKEGLF